MPSSEKARVKQWEERTRSANKLYKEWYDRYKIKNLEEYYLGKQWMGLTETDAEKRYVINLVFSSIETNKPSMIFNNPKVKMEPKPGRSDDFGNNDIFERAKLCQDTVQTFIDDPDVDFVGETSLALHEAHFRFGVVEVGYTADWIDNPDAGKPVLKEKTKEEDPDQPSVPDTEPRQPIAASPTEEPVIDEETGEPLLQPEMLIMPFSEGLYLKRIPALNYRISISNKNKATRNDWVGYWEWHYVEDIKRNPVYKKGAKGLRPTGTINSEMAEVAKDALPEEKQAIAGMCKVWKIWELRTLKRHVFVEGHERFLLEGQPFKFLPHAFIKFYEVLDSFYPCPPVFQWLDSQNEVNETRDAQRAHRRRFYRRYATRKNAMEEPEKEKFETGGDGVLIEMNDPNAIRAIDDAPMGSDVWANLDASKTDFMMVSGVSGDQRGVAESETATQASIIEKHSQLRESNMRAKVQNWLADICRLMLLTVRDNMHLEFWIKRNVDTLTDIMRGGEETKRVSAIWEAITNEDLAGDFDLDIGIDLSTMSPVTQEAQKMEWNQVLQLLSNPSICAILAQSPALLQKTLRLYGVTSSAEMAEIAKAMQNVVVMSVAAAGAMPGGPPGGKPGAKPPARPNGQPPETKAEAGGRRLQ